MKRIVHIMPLLKYMFVFVIVLTFILSGLIVNILQCILYFGLRPYSKYFYRKINYYLSYTFFCQMVCTVEWYSQCDLYIYMNKKDFANFGKEHACVIANHRFEFDWMFIGTISDKVHTAGNFKAYMKKVIQYIPPLGWCLYFSENVFLERSFDKDKDIIQKQLAEIMDFPDPIWIILFPEGTRFNEIRYKDCVILAQQKGLPVFKYHLIPKPRGFLTSLPIFRNKVGAVYDVTIAVADMDVKPTLLNMILGTKIKAHFYINRIPLDKIPHDEEKATAFLNHLFQQKDKLQESFMNTGDYFLESGVERIEPFKLKKNYLTLLNSLGWICLITLPLLWNWVKALYITPLYTFLYTLIPLAALYILCFVSLHANSVKKDKSK